MISENAPEDSTTPGKPDLATSSPTPAADSLDEPSDNNAEELYTDDVPPESSEPAPPLDPRDIALAQKTKECEERVQQLAELTNRYHRALADYDNLNKRMTAKIQTARIDGIADFLKKILAVVDSFDSALRQMEASKIDKKAMEGFEMLSIQFTDLLEKEGLKAIPAKGTKFDPNRHEAVARGSQDDVEDDIVLTEYEKGYMFKDRVLRPAKVVINAK
ncbi:MAG: nucleotide exchange factor GrpE [Candidatus Ozemobacteraceae bacterium]